MANKRSSFKTKALVISFIVSGIVFGEWVEQDVTYRGRVGRSDDVIWQRGEIVRGVASDKEVERNENPIQSYIKEVFGKDAEMALKIAYCESRFDPHAVGGLGERGIFQIHPVHTARLERMGWGFDDMFDWRRNIELAKILFDEQYWRPWACWRIVK